MSIFITGSTGFIGSAAVRNFAAAGFNVRAGVRSADKDIRRVPHAHEVVVHGNLEQEDRWQEILEGSDVVVHIAGPAHLNLGPAEIPTAQRVIIEGTRNLAVGAAVAGVKRFLYLSTAHVFGSRSPTGRPFREADPMHPQSHYAIAKMQAEQDVILAASGSDMDYVIMRPPMVYGPCAPGNFSRLLRLVRSSWPLPLLGAHALRSFISIHNLTSALVVAADHPKAANGCFNISDGEDCSTVQMIKLIANAQKNSARLFWAPKSLLQAGAYLMGRRADFHKLFQPFQIDASLFRNCTGWMPPLSLSEGVYEAVEIPSAS
jgi:nucleoside-diphosphate-sugar epimerase